MDWVTAMWFGSGFALTLLIALAWDLFDYDRVRRKEARKAKLRTDWARILERRE